MPRMRLAQTSPAVSIVDRPARVRVEEIGGEYYLEIIDREDGLLHAALHITNADDAADLRDQVHREMGEALATRTDTDEPSSDEDEEAEIEDPE